MVSDGHDCAEAPRVPGADIAGRVEAVGKSVTRFRVGDEVFGDLSSHGWGGFAEYVSTSEEALAPKPSNVSFEEAAAVPMAAVTALQALRDCGRVRAGQRVLGWRHVRAHRRNHGGLSAGRVPGAMVRVESDEAPRGASERR
ncbi:alcohol dehydrogenase catalytic domain-containing protein [Sorangium sp. So ce176]|uniref:alcohol dehydrogenase catalytic domain-containing protein n=1 Tax=Sorangium sp. So ce176 TaxID=3133286 RepID=UPI003F60F3FD